MNRPSAQKRRPRKGARPKAKQLDCPPVELRIESLGARGDGQGESELGPLFVPDTAPGDRILAQPLSRRGNGIAARLLDVLESGPGRQSAPCPHASECGGCGLQHIAESTLAEVKRGWLLSALSRAGVEEPSIAPIVSIGPGTRRRLRLASVRTKDRIILGFNRRAERDVVDIGVCLVARPELVAVLEPLRGLLQSLPSLGRFTDVQITLTDTGLDVLLIPSASADLNLVERDALTEFAEAYDLARIGLERDGFPEPIAARRSPQVAFGGIFVDIPMGGFLQPSQEGETALVSLALAALDPKAQKVADLYCGSGSFALPFLAADKQVFAAEGSRAAVDALRRATGGRSIQTECRDLARNPVPTEVLNRYDMVLFDPPRAGAAEQAEALSYSDVPTVVAVSCNPATLARDIATLQQGGYAVDTVTPVDQFTWSAHLEAVAILRRH